MLGLLLLAAGLSIAPAQRPRVKRQIPHTLDQRVALLEAKEILQSQQLWSVQSRWSPEALKSLEDVSLHLARDQEQDERVRMLTAEVQSMSQRLASLELLLRGGVPVESAMIPVAPGGAEPRAVKAKKKLKKRTTASR